MVTVRAKRRGNFVFTDLWFWRKDKRLHSERKVEGQKSRQIEDEDD